MNLELVKKTASKLSFNLNLMDESMSNFSSVLAEKGIEEPLSLYTSLSCYYLAEGDNEKLTALVKHQGKMFSGRLFHFEADQLITESQAQLNVICEELHLGLLELSSILEGGSHQIIAKAKNIVKAADSIVGDL